MCVPAKRMKTSLYFSVSVDATVDLKRCAVVVRWKKKHLGVWIWFEVHDSYPVTVEVYFTDFGRSGFCASLLVPTMAV
jgi:hypothetical protein